MHDQLGYGLANRRIRVPFTAVATDFPSFDWLCGLTIPHPLYKASCNPKIFRPGPNSDQSLASSLEVNRRYLHTRSLHDS
jgi:hypothetical protein